MACMAASPRLMVPAVCLSGRPVLAGDRLIGSLSTAHGPKADASALCAAQEIPAMTVHPAVRGHSAFSKSASVPSDTPDAWLISVLFALVSLLMAMALIPASALAQLPGEQTTAALPFAPPQPVVPVIDARIGVHPEKTRFVLELGSAVRFSTRLRSSPQGVIVDLPAIAWPTGGASRAGNGLIARYTLAPADGGRTRLIFDTTGPVRIREAFLIPPRDGRQSRLVIDLEPTSVAEMARLVAAQGNDRPQPPVPSQPVAVPQVVPVAVPRAVPQAKPVPDRPAVDRSAQRKPMIVIDPGHGGVDPGAISASGIMEKDVTLAMARELRRQLEATGAYRVRLTRDRDTFIRLRDRVGIAREAGADLFVSLHADSISSDQVRGLSVYTMSDRASDREAEQLAAKENRADAIAGLNLADENDLVASILINLAQRDTMNHSKRFANLALNTLKGEVVLLPSRPHREAGFAVLSAPDVPSVLIEMGYLSSPTDANLLNTPTHRAKLGRGLARGIDAYFKWLAKAERS